MDEHYIMTVIKALGQRIANLEWQLECSEEEKARLIKQLKEMEAKL